jgi:hypothetical protein
VARLPRIALGDPAARPDAVPCSRRRSFLRAGLSSWAHFAHQQGVPTPEFDSFVKAAVFSTLTNVCRMRLHAPHAPA